LNGEQQENGEWKYSVGHCVNDFQNTFPNFPVNYQKLVQQIYKCVGKFRNVGTLGRKTGSGAPKKRIPEIVADVSARMKQSSKNPPRRLAQEMDLSNGICHKILKQDLNLHSYKITVVQELLPRDFPTRIRYCQWFLNQIKILICNANTPSRPGIVP
jgi:hypothetical protein